MSVATIIPAHDIDVLLKKILQVERVRIVDHVLVKQSVRITQDECWQPLELLVFTQVFLIELLIVSWEEHSINLGLRFVILYPNLLTIQGFG